MSMGFGPTALNRLTRLRKFKRKRVSSYDRSGGNGDDINLNPGEKRVIFDVDGPGCIKHIWTTQSLASILDEIHPFYIRQTIVRMWWDNEEHPSVECPLGDFFGLGHGETKNFNSLPLQMSPLNGKAMNSWWAMPFKTHAKIEIHYDVPEEKGKGKKADKLSMYYYIDYESYDEWPEDDVPVGYFHATFHKVEYQDTRHDFVTGEKMDATRYQRGGKNTRENGGYDRNHKILHAKGRGHFVGCHIDIDNKMKWWHPMTECWPGEGDDMIFIDDDIGGEPTLYGTGTEDYVNTAWGPWQKFDGLYHGIIKGGYFPFGKLSYYRYHIEDPISFEREIQVTIEHGHNNHRGDIWETTAYWYQLEPHMKLELLPDYEHRMPRKTDRIKWWLKKILKLGFIGIGLWLLIIL
jgi:D-arabinan exo alpha-(1,3)/(1,5)-arabinofuranosidase (non-reducing end)